MNHQELLNYVKEYLKLDQDIEDNSVLSSIILSQQEYLKNAGVKENLESDLYKLALCMLVSQRYEDRLGKIRGNNTFFINSLIIQLKNSQ